MKYGMRERISGAVILLALAVIFIPMLFDEPPSREAQPEPTLTIEQPIEVERQDVAEPEPPASLGQIQTPELRNGDSSSSPPAESPPAPDDESRQREIVESESASQVAKPETRSDPIAELASRPQGEKKQQPPASPAEKAPGESGEDWAVQAGSFGEPGNAERFEAELEAEGFQAFRRARDNDLTTVYVGPFASSEEGEKARTELKQKANIQGLLIRLRGQE